MRTTFTHRRLPPRAFTLVELLVAISILAMLSALGLAMLRNVSEYARIDRTKVQVARIDTYVMERYNSYLTRTVPVRIYNDHTPQVAAYVRLVMIRELMRMEMPERITDLANGPQTITVPTTSGMPATRTYTLPQPALHRAMRNKANAINNQWLTMSQPAHSANESAECLYLILLTLNTEGRSPIDSFSATEIGDVDGDGMKEILDAWGRPIQFLRWAPGYVPPAVVTTQTDALDANSFPVSPDPFDWMRVDPGYGANSPKKPFALKPLIFSAGQDRHYDINMGALSYSTTNPPSYPFYSDGTAGYKFVGTPMDTDGDGYTGYEDNITNHYVETP